MKNAMEYKGYKARIDYDGDDKCFIGHIVGINDVVGFHGSSVDELRAAFEDAVDDYIATCAAVGKQPERSYSGAVMFRVAPEIHASFAQMAELQGKSLNQLGEEVMKQAADAIMATRDLKTGKFNVKSTRPAPPRVAKRKERA